jgi:molybdopterin-guanine dinucleotide biosynthesis protein A
MPLITSEAIEWLMAQRSPGKWALLPTVDEGRVEPLFALFEPQCHSLMQDLLDRGAYAPRHLSDHPRVATVTPPGTLSHAWLNINSEEDLIGLSSE